MVKIPLNDTVAQMNRLYINYRKAFLEQYQQGYSTQKRTLTDYWVKQHLEKKRTIGVKLGTQGLTKFMTFDVDFRDNLPKAKEITEDIASFLNSEYGIGLQDIHIHFSGGKGYHVTLFFDKSIQDKELYPFYEEVISKLELKKTEVEFRASSQYGVKLPLGIHRKTGKFMGYCEYNAQTGLIRQLNEQESYRYFLSIKQQSMAEFKEFVLEDIEVKEKRKAPTFTPKKAEEFEDVMSELNLDGKSIEELHEEIKLILSKQRLIQPSSRHIMTLRLSIFFKEQGWTIEDTKEMVSQVLTNTYDNPDSRLLISEDTTKEFMLSEVDRLANLTYQRAYKLSERRKDVYLKKEEILEILEVKEYHLKKLLFSMLIHSKRYAKSNGEFFMAYSTMIHMGNTGNRTRLLQYMTQLEAKEKVQIISRNQLDTIRTKLEGTVINKPNVYKVSLDSSELESTEFHKLEGNKDLTLEQITALLIDKKVAKTMIPRRQWESHFKLNYAS